LEIKNYNLMVKVGMKVKSWFYNFLFYKCFLLSDCQIVKLFDFADNLAIWQFNNERCLSSKKQWKFKI